MLRRRRYRTFQGETLLVRHVINAQPCSGKKKLDADVGKKIMTHWIFLGSLSMVTRCIAIYQSPYLLRELYLPLFIGVMQDGVVILQALNLVAVFRLIGLKSSWGTATLAMVFCNLVPFIDILLQLQNCPRVDIGFVINLLYNFQIFYPSLKAAFSSIFASLFLAWTFFVLLGVLYLMSCANNKVAVSESFIVRGRRIVTILGMTYIGWTICLAFYQRQDPSMLYHVENAIFKLQHESLGDAVTPMITANAVGNVTSASEIYTVPESELSELLKSTSYPTLRKTIGYRGSKLFDVQVLNDGDEKQQPNVLLIMMESWKDLRHLGPDARRIITPEFDKLRSTGIDFDAHYTPSVATSRTLMSNLFGNLPGNLVEPSIKEYPELNLAGLPTMMKTKGYHNAFISAADLKWDNWHTQLRRHGFDQLEGWRDIRKLLRDRNYPPIEKEKEGNWGLWDEDAFDGLYEHMMDLKANGTKSFINFYSVSSHWPFLIPDSYDVPEDIKRFARTEEDHNYLATLAYSDQHLGRFISKCRRAGLLNNTIVLIQGDHGGPSPTFLVTNGVRDEVSHVPALLLADGRLPTDQIGKSISQVSSQADVFATVADIIGIPKGGMWNHGIGSSMMREDPDKIVILENYFKGKTIGCRQGDIKVVQEGSAAPKVYNMISDPLEEHPLSSYDLKKTATLIEMTRRMVDMFNSMYGMNQFVPGA